MNLRRREKKIRKKRSIFSYPVGVICGVLGTNYVYCHPNYLICEN